MQYLGIEYFFQNQPILDPAFLPFGVWREAYLAQASNPVSIAVEREGGKISVFQTALRDDAYAEANYRYLERFVKMLLWSVGGFRVFICGCDALTKRLQEAYHPGGKREFDATFMEDVYERPFEIVVVDKENLPKANEQSVRVGGHTNGCRIGFDAGGSDRKVSAVIDGETVYSEEVVWHPKLSEDPQYQYDGIVSAFKTAASKMPRVDGIGVSSAGVFIGNAPMVSSLFIKVPRSRREEVKTIYDRAAKELGDVPIVVANDGDVTALAGSMSLGDGAVMGLAMGTSEAVGYVNQDGNILGWFNELAFAPVDLCEDAMVDEWSTDSGVGCKYFSQDAVIKLAPRAGIELDAALTPAEKLKAIQTLLSEGSEPAKEIFRTIGCYLAHTLVLYSSLYDLHHLLVLGRVASGMGGELIVSECRRVLEEEYPDLNRRITVTLPDEKFRRVGQSMAAASLPEV
jgi:predicted NBD/HSP70 family sugar kinase